MEAFLRVLRNIEDTSRTESVIEPTTLVLSNTRGILSPDKKFMVHKSTSRHESSTLSVPEPHTDDPQHLPRLTPIGEVPEVVESPAVSNQTSHRVPAVLRRFDFSDRVLEDDSDMDDSDCVHEDSSDAGLLSPQRPSTLQTPRSAKPGRHYTAHLHNLNFLQDTNANRPPKERAATPTRISMSAHGAYLDTMNKLGVVVTSPDDLRRQNKPLSFLVQSDKH